MFRQNRDDSEKLVKAILDESGMSPASIELITAIFRKQREILIALADVVKNLSYRNQHIERRLDELLKKVDPEKAADRKQNLCESSCEPKIPGRCLF